MFFFPSFCSAELSTKIMFLHGSSSLVQITKPASYWGLDWSLRPHLQSPAYLNCSLLQNWQHQLSTLNKHIELSVDASLITTISMSIPWASVLLFVGSACCQGGTMERCRFHLAPHSEECSSGITVNCKFFFLEDAMGCFLFSLLQVWTCHKGAVTLCSEPLTYLLNWCPGDCAVALSCAWVISRSWQCHTWPWPHYLFGTIFFLCTSKQGIWHSLHSSVFIIINY